MRSYAKFNKYPLYLSQSEQTQLNGDNSGVIQVYFFSFLAPLSHKTNGREARVNLKMAGLIVTFVTS